MHTGHLVGTCNYSLNHVNHTKRQENSLFTINVSQICQP